MKTIAITLGDPGGIGPEVALKALYQNRWPATLRFVLIGNRSILRRQAAQFRLPLPPAWQLSDGKNNTERIVNWEPERDLKQKPIPLTWRPACNAMRPPAALRAAMWAGSIAGRPGVTGKTQGQAAVLWIQAAVSGCMAGRFDALVTGPICKQSLRLAGLPFPGHTEFLAALTGTRSFAMMLLGGPLRVVLVTRHLPLAKVAAGISRAAIAEAVQLTAQALPWLGVRPKTIGVCALNPHAGDEGVLGREEITTIRPALRALRRQGLTIEGPVPGDVIFHQALQGRYGAVVAMYHDQGLGPLKMIAFEEGVNLTLGLPIVRTSPDHGTAFDIAGKGLAHAGSMVAAIRLAERLARRKNPWSPRSGLRPTSDF
ncbi:MAG: 4-hydroxythreonine-4-phosphate dehydrogenase PdxA [Kiritimatiellae bacterium]|nr:4-hydroxythreonine-4-phosphate dehydrogenase PdxA [Verrucomicrobiota bacterium]MBU4365882.1 4-hydroxythreonine-4-phosphate dehydrogenase PdxA [Verrucomicrobiota bacterium]MCG2660418.1 4-hydroxythreonine-4-phosphate dehydrogenase PdxA [Kiritimatiellia bacterium]